MGSNAFADLEAWIEKTKELPEPVSYIVIDHVHPPGEKHIDSHDAQGRRYLVCSPALLDSVSYRQRSREASLAGVPVELIGIPVHKREDLPEDWPNGR